MFESVYHGVPLVTMPVFCDHDANAAKAVADGYALRLELETLTTEKLSKFTPRTNTQYFDAITNQMYALSVKGILKVVHDERYRQAVK